MAIAADEKRLASQRGAQSWVDARRNDPEKMKKWQRAMHLGRLRAARARKLAASQKETTVAKRKGKGSGTSKGSHWMQDPKRAREAARKGHLTRKRKRRAAERELAAREAQRKVVEHHSPDELVHLDFPLVAGGQTRATSGGFLGDDLTQLTPVARKQLALEGLRFVKILLEP